LTKKKNYVFLSDVCYRTSDINEHILKNMNELEKLTKSPLVQRSADALTDLIIEGNLDTGSFLPTEQDLCGRLGVGRSTIREAIKIIEAKGLVERVHGVGVKIVDESQQAASNMLKLLFRRRGASIRELNEVRTIYEITAVKLAAERADDDDLNEIGKYLGAMQSIDTPSKEYIRADFSFHLAIARATHNNVLILIVETIRPLLEDMIFATLKSDPRPELRRRYHENIYEAIKKRDGEEAAKAMAEHLKGAKEMVEYLENNKSEDID
jgi:GntR family transcriptional repressor for pyruvate dehydrogenase complex